MATRTSTTMAPHNCYVIAVLTVILTFSVSDAQQCNFQPTMNVRIDNSNTEFVSHLQDHTGVTSAEDCEAKCCSLGEDECNIASFIQDGDDYNCKTAICNDVGGCFTPATGGHVSRLVPNDDGAKQNDTTTNVSSQVNSTTPEEVTVTTPLLLQTSDKTTDMTAENMGTTPKKEPSTTTAPSTSANNTSAASSTTTPAKTGSNTSTTTTTEPETITPTLASTTTQATKGVTSTILQALSTTTAASTAGKKSTTASPANDDAASPGNAVTAPTEVSAVSVSPAYPDYWNTEDEEEWEDIQKEWEDEEEWEEEQYEDALEDYYNETREEYYDLNGHPSDDGQTETMLNGPAPVLSPGTAGIVGAVVAIVVLFVIVALLIRKFRPARAMSEYRKLAEPRNMHEKEPLYRDDGTSYVD